MVSSLIIGFILLCAFVGSALGAFGIEKDESKTGGGYSQFLSAVVNKGYIEDHLTGKVEWKRSATYSPALAAVPQAQYIKLKKAQHGEDIELYNKYFKGMEKGVILESGAFDGFNLSSTLFFEKFASWSAIHIEADPGNYAKLSVNRRNSINVHMALCDEPRILHYVDTGITLAHGIAEFMPEKFLRMHHGHLYRNRSRIQDLREIPCFPVKYLFRHLDLKELDIWVLDTEGSELAVLNGVNFARITIKVIIMECDGHDGAKDQQKMNFLRQQGYHCSHSHVTCFCKLTADEAGGGGGSSGRKREPNGGMGSGVVGGVGDRGDANVVAVERSGGGGGGSGGSGGSGSGGEINTNDAGRKGRPGKPRKPGMAGKAQRMKKEASVTRKG